MESLNPKRLKTSDKESSATVTEEKKYFNFASCDFNDIVKMDAFVDKTLLIKAIFEETPMILITAPRRFGKSTNMDMLKKFVEIQVDERGVAIHKEESSNHEIFKGRNLLIYQDQGFFNQHFATYPVIYVDFKVASGNSFDEIVEKFRLVLHETFKQHNYLLTSDKLDSGEISGFKRYYSGESYRNLTRTDITRGLYFLSQYLYKHFDNKGVFVLIDEYDALINSAMFENDIDVNQVNELIDQLLALSLKDNDYVERVLLTGISCFPAVGLSGANNIIKYAFLDKHPFVKFYGLTEPEVDVLLSKFNINEEMKENVKSYYNGYCTKSGVKLFSIWSVLHYLNDKTLKPYWQQSGIAFGLRQALYFPAVWYSIERLFNNIPIRIEILNQRRLEQIVDLKDVMLRTNNRSPYNPIYLSFLLQQGYLTYTKTANHPNAYSIIITNAEIRNEFKEKLETYNATNRCQGCRTS